ncbi:circularly permuted type 2 ATP-grasp protein [Polaromonas sp.]|uniref:circularly permuted type 2 ATP-grasp protein n=1 Tax=Polaromonas sp. TaxID=1869339 RepID=UPI001A35E0C3|nr:circularly permuted type 2 ATP-grasp protein [Burkholderiales bacterium]MBH2019773.1 circularly permuted type 2 ATP-grasp protein [Burkholderiales bacterium]
MLNQLLADYPASPDSFDEMLDESNQPRAHWRTILDCLAHEAPDVMRKRTESVQRQVRENGVTYNVYTDDKGIQRPWDLNVLPMILPHDEWAGIEAAVIQRATLMNRLLIDVYGEQKMLEERLLPPALIHGHAGFLRPCHGMQHKDGIALHFYAIDLARAPNGRWWAVADRTQAPSGAGYALENRSVISRTFPDLLRDLKVQHLAGFFDTMRDSLAQWGRQCAASGNDGVPLRNSEAPLIVLLTPGPYNETYYEQAYLARYLGLPLVEGSDLTVRNGMVWHKTLSGMQRVHVIMRRVDDDYCDPLELRTDSALGVAGLTEAARRGNVLIANSLGSSLLESGALLGFLPALCKRLLGEPLKMPSVATWWCGEPAALEEVIKRLDQLIIKPSIPQLRQFPVFGKDLTGDARTAFINKMRANPKNYVAQELVRLSQAPIWKPGASSGLSACAIGLRVYACATPKGYVVMPGGLTRVATGSDSRIITMQRGGGSKDTWIQASTQAEVHSLLKRTITSQDLIRDDTHLSSRVAENLFWFGRNAERCDNTARLLRVALNFLFHVGAANRGDEWPTVVALCTWFHLIAPREPGKSQRQADQPEEIPGDTQIEAALMLAVVSPDVSGLARQQQQLYRSASQLRERFSVDNWRALNQMVQEVSSADHQLSQSETMTILDDATTSLMTMSGFTLDGMTRDLGWRFLSLGRRLERLQFQTVALQHALGMEANGSLNWLLELSDSIITYRTRYRAQPEWLPVLDLLLLDESNTRSILFQLDGVLKSLKKISLNYGPCGEEQLRLLKNELVALTPDTDLYCGNAHLIDLLYRIQMASAEMSEQISVQFFSYTGTHQDRTQTA